MVRLPLPSCWTALGKFNTPAVPVCHLSVEGALDSHRLEVQTVSAPASPAGMGSEQGRAASSPRTSAHTGGRLGTISPLRALTSGW